ncbi:lytic polysaccharide monooxygenase [Lophiostoma macrostomum CBS 122681]|uniref:Lytic polysaccharide monooxygenase n=1 Tax=Lophiostoma macrostomum CBS 122681 TaxID=1314788 RepID=A0A6A6T7K0_9PLEO|nr:lytic polysaccharide monooxygenase [Lophiostoma macrostomum CBS 122681]
MSKIFATGAVLAAIFSQVAGHTYVEEWDVGGQTYPGFYLDSKHDPGNKSPAWWTNQGWGYQPVYGSSINKPDIIAHIDASPSPYTAEAKAGSDVTVTWHHTGSCGGGENGWDCSHHGWTATYLAKCDGDCKDADKESLEFFNIDQHGLIDYPEGTRYSESEDGKPEGYPGFWATDKIFYEDDNKHTFTIPQDIPSGNYVIRTEVMSVHNNGDISERQFWPQAFNVKVTGGSGTTVPAGKKGTELYSAKDTLLAWDLYWHTAGKTVPKFTQSDDIPLVSVATNSAATKVRRHARDFKN